MKKDVDHTLPKSKLDLARERAEYDPDHAVSSAIRVALAKTHLDSAEIARRCGMDKATIYRFMTGERSLSLNALDKIFRSLGMVISVGVWGLPGLTSEGYEPPSTKPPSS
jgi:transcriptional regulator with XRE-family HTH domain